MILCRACLREDKPNLVELKNPVTEKTERIERFSDARGNHVHDSNVYTYTGQCSEGHKFMLTRKIPCSHVDCAKWNNDDKVEEIA